MARAETSSTWPETADNRLSQIYDRAPHADGRFWYSVVTTGVFCRPTCPSRRARPEHIRFHDTLDEARRTGFRPCRRCHPEQPSAVVRDQALVARACALIQAAEVPLSSRALASTLGVSTSHIHRLFNRTLGTTPGAWARASRCRPDEAA
ncbi:Ada metal-binding domain-containing protein [Brevundimonas lenta]|uniref:Methylphosphotriester-DNA--protein-cysteine methyltransferase n=1 Tax=Brevundimonas lenta TaxID=424796 RepID=A0A7W6JEF6_9CAUL|nr:methylphosphotriester-DNA--protein-cysteine methyltransferase [Brevundimonas lenta]